MHIIFFNTKGGVSKSTLCEFSSMELQRLGYKIHVDNIDQQEHVTLIENEDADFFLYDTAGAFTSANVELLKSACDVNSLNGAFIAVLPRAAVTAAAPLTRGCRRVGRWGRLPPGRLVVPDGHPG